jgi:hypothetical protein
MPDINDIPTAPNAEDIRRRFTAKVRITDGCWQWTAMTVKPLPYGRMAVGGKRAELAHRLSYVLHCGPIPDGMNVLHSCDNPRCVRPSHLFLGDNLTNVADKVSKGRQSAMPGEAHPMAKLSEAQVVEILRSTATGAALARRFGVTPTAICSIRRGRSWGHLQPSIS